MLEIISLPPLEEMRICELWAKTQQLFKSKYNIEDADIEQAIDAAKEPFRQMTYSAFSDLDFNNKVFICAYLRYYAKAHFVITRCAALEFFTQCPVEYFRMILMPTVKIVSIGGGPGNDLYGFCSALLKHCKLTRLLPLKLDSFVFDRRKNWKLASNIAHDMFSNEPIDDVTTFKNTMPKKPIYHKVDFTNIKEMTKVRPLLKKANVILMVKVLSVMEQQTKRQILQEIFSSMSVGSIFLFVDVHVWQVLNVLQEYNCFLQKFKILHNRVRRQYVMNTSNQFMKKSSFEVCVVKRVMV